MLAAVRSRFDDSRGAGVRFVIGTSTSPTLKRLLDRMTERWPESKWLVYEPVLDDSMRTALKNLSQAIDADFAEPIYDFSKAQVVASIDRDFLAAREGPPCYVRQFADARRIVGASRQSGDDAADKPAEQIRLYHLGSTPTVTSSKADHPLYLTPSAVVQAVIELALRLDVAVPTSASAATNEPASADAKDRTRQWIDRLVTDLKRAPARSLLVAGREQPPLVHWLVHAINAKLGSIGQCIHFIESPQVRPSGQTSNARMLAELADECRAGKVQALFILGGDPLGGVSGEAQLTKALRRVELTIALVDSPNATASRCQWAIPRSHFLEAWGDARAYNGLASIVQPMIMPMHPSLSDIELLAALLDDSESGYQAVRKTWNDRLGADEDDPRWQTALATGIIEGTAAETLEIDAPQEPGEFDPQDLPKPNRDAAVFELVLHPDPTVWDGRFANNSWLQELPKPLTHLVWDNPAWLAPSDAAALGVQNGDVIAVHAGEQRIEVPVWIVPGHATGCVSLFSGYGAATSGRVARGAGFDVSPLFVDGRPFRGQATLHKTGRTYKLVT
ncbi:MAG: molybdopterin dinucleotide binding domain-containing protein, partial [Aureliella sp.]